MAKFDWKNFYSTPTPALFRKIGDSINITCMGIAGAMVSSDYNKHVIIAFMIAGFVAKGFTNLFKNV